MPDDPRRIVDQGDGFTIFDNPAESRYEAELDGELAGVIEYFDEDGWLVFDHTEVFEAFEGKGVGSRLAKASLDDVRARGLYVNPQCPFIVGYIKRHREYRDLIVSIRGNR